MLDVGIVAAFTAGILTFLSPCILPLIPAYLGFIAGGSLQDTREDDSTGGGRFGAVGRRFVPALAFVLGFSLVFIVLGFVAAGLMRFIAPYMTIFQILAGNLLVIGGLHFLKVLQVPFLYRAFNPDFGSKAGGFGGGFLFGTAFGFGWSPCAGPILATIVTLAAMKSHTVIESGMYLGVYSLGIGVPFLLAALLVDPFMKAVRRFGKLTHYIEIFTGLSLVITGLLLQTGYLQKFAFLIAETLPGLG